MLESRHEPTGMRALSKILGVWLLAWPATAMATPRLEALHEPVLADLAAREIGPARPLFDSADRRLEGATIALRIDDRQLVLGRVEEATLVTRAGSVVVGGFELAYRRDLLVGKLRPFASAGIGWIGGAWDPLAAEISPDVQPMVRIVVGMELPLPDGWAAEAIAPIRWLAETDRAFAAATLGLRHSF